MNFINKKKLELYKFLNRRGDAEKIAKSAGVVRGTVYIAMMNGRCSMDVEEAIDKYYAKRIQELKKIINAAENA